MRLYLGFFWFIDLPSFVRNVPLHCKVLQFHKDNDISMLNKEIFQNKGEFQQKLGPELPKNRMVNM